MDELKKLLENAGVKESVEDWDSPLNYEVTDDSGGHYAVIFQDMNGKEQMVVEANGRGIAYADVGGAGSMNSNITDKDQMMDAVFAFANQSDYGMDESTDLVQETRFSSSEQMLAHIVGELHRIVRDAVQDPDQQWDDLMWELDNLIEQIDDSDVG